ncbi:MAG TPA: histidine kinase [Chitinophagaceae bacterium]|nr:histidine kinase [Chitinophagaceae bacterium]
MAVLIISKLIFIVVLRYLLLPYFSRSKQIGWLVLAVLLLTGVFIAWEMYNATHGLFFPFHHARHAPVFWINLFIYSLLAGNCVAWYFAQKWMRAEKQRRELVEVQLGSELNFLKSQINPHFLFNTLNNLFSLAQKNNNEELAGGIYKLSGLMRYMIYESSVDKIQLSKEILYIRDFIGLSKLRFDENEVEVNLNIEGDPDAYCIAPMLLVPFVENAFKHGVKLEHRSVIDISIVCTAASLVFHCRNPLFDTTDEHTYGGIGLENVRRRLQLLYPGKHRLVTEALDGRYHVHLELH